MKLDVFDFDYLPEHLPGRENEIKEIYNFIEMFKKYKRGGLFLITGKSGTGKTASVKKAIQEFKDIVYINAAYNYTPLSVINEISDQLDIQQSRRGKARDEIFNFLMKNIDSLFVVIDEADMLFKKNSKANELLYNLLRTKEEFSVPSAIILISNDPGFSLLLDYRIRTMLTSHLEFKPYKPSTLRKIIEQRAMLANISVPQEVIDVCVGFSAKLGDARQGITLLYLTIVESQKDGEEISLEHIYRAKKKIEISLRERLLYDLTDTQKEIYRFIASREKTTSKELYSSLGISERTIRKNLEVLINKRLIKQEYVEGKKGRSRIFYV